MPARAVLHVEDDPGMGELVRFAFEQMGFEGRVVNARTLGAACATLEQVRRGVQELDFVVTDLGLPDGSGLELVRRIRSDPSLALVPVVVLSGQADPGTVAQAYALGANCFLTKSDRERHFPRTLEALYRCWVEHALLPEPRIPAWHAGQAVSVG